MKTVVAGRIQHVPILYDECWSDCRFSGLVSFGIFGMDHDSISWAMIGAVMKAGYGQ